MKYDYTVKFGGVYYAAGEDVPCEDVSPTDDTPPSEDAPETDGSNVAAEEKKPSKPKKQ